MNGSQNIVIVHQYREKQSIICVQVRHFGSKCLFKRYWEFSIVWKGYVWRLQFQIQDKNIPIIDVNITTFEVNVWSTMNGVQDKYKGNTFLSIHLGLI